MTGSSSTERSRRPRRPGGRIVVDAPDQRLPADQHEGRTAGDEEAQRERHEPGEEHRFSGAGADRAVRHLPRNRDRSLCARPTLDEPGDHQLGGRGRRCPASGATLGKAGGSSADTASVTVVAMTAGGAARVYAAAGAHAGRACASRSRCPCQGFQRRCDAAAADAIVWDCQSRRGASRARPASVAASAAAPPLGP